MRYVNNDSSLSFFSLTTSFANVWVFYSIGKIHNVVLVAGGGMEPSTYSRDKELGYETA